MTNAEMIELVKSMSGESSDTVVSASLSAAGQEIINYVYQFVVDKSGLDVPVNYQYKQCEIATYLLNKRGAEGQTVHNENGVNRTYEAAGIPKSMWNGVIPFCGTMGGDSQ